MLFRRIKGELKISTIKLLFKWYNSYYAFNKVKGSGNLDVATGLNYRYKHSKYWD
ncbi:putative outer membrane protein [Helicobacter pylori CPY6081]|nr:putative outer membrane protein [Helicobacter pylori CPY6081]